MEATPYRPISWKKIIKHLSVWLLVLWFLNSDFTDLHWGAFIHDQGTLLLPFSYGFSFNAFIFYIAAYWLIPSYLVKKATSKFWIKTLLLIFGLSALEFALDVSYIIYINESEVITPETLEIPHNYIAIEFAAIFLTILFIHFLYLGFAFLFRLPSDWTRNERLKSQLIEDKLMAELEFLKAQINPHFLFNGINSIYHLIGTDDDSAKEVLLRFSGLLRYQLYECSEEFIPLLKELEYINNYIKLEETRKGEDVQFNINLPQHDELFFGDLKIAPLLFTPFLENSFKYLSLYSKKELNILNVNINVANGTLNFTVVNTVNQDTVRQQQLNDGGIGIENVKRRLGLLYPEKHKLTVIAEQKIHTVNLKLNLKQHSDSTNK